MSTILKILSFAGIVLMTVAVFTSDLPRLVMDGDIDNLRQLSSDNLGGMLLLTMLVMFLQNLLTAVPLVLLVTVNTALFGFAYGFIWSWLSSVIAASLVFVLTRYWLQSWLMRRVNDSIRQRIEQNGLLYVLVCRLIPVMPSSLINMSAGASTIRFRDYLVGTFIGNLLFMTALAGVMLGIMKAGWEVAVLVAAAVAVAGGVFYMRKRKQSVKHEQGQYLEK